VAHRVGDGLGPSQAGALAPVGDAEELLFDLAEDQVGADRLVEAAAFGVAGAGDHGAKQVLLPNDVDVVFRVGGGGGFVDQRLDDGGAADPVEAVQGAQALGEGEGVDGEGGARHFGQGLKEQAVRGREERFRNDAVLGAQVQHAAVAGCIQQDRAKDAAFGFGAVRDGAQGRGEGGGCLHGG